MKVLTVNKIKQQAPYLTGKIIIGSVTYLTDSNCKYTRKVEVICTGNGYCAEYLWDMEKESWFFNY